MRRLGLMAMLFLAAAAWALAQAPGERDSNRVYSPGGDVIAPTLKQPTTAVIPADEKLRGVKHVCSLRVVIAADGVPGVIEVLSKPSPFDEAAIAAVRQSQFEAGTFREKPVAVRTDVYVPFGAEKLAPIPLLDVVKARQATPPHVLNNVNAEFSEEARRAGVEGTALVSVTVSEEGLPINPKIVTSAGCGLDENAIDSVRKYRFKPAMMDGIPFSVPISVEVSFRLGRH
jgi:TonB family protein